MRQTSSNRLEELIRERARLDVELERCKEIVTVLFVDIVGSTRFYDEHGDVAGLVMVQKALDLLIPIVEDYEGTVIKTIGDAILARYCDVEQAVRSAIEMQCSLAERNRDRRPNDQIHVRVAINLGLALLKGNDVFGDVVNVTARIEGATDADEIAISPSVYEKIQHLPDLPVKKKASGVNLKGKSEKLDLYSVVWRPGEAAGPAPPRPSKEQLFIATGLHTGLADAVQTGRAGVSSARSGTFPKSAASLDKTVVLGTQEVEELPAVGVRFALARVGPDGSLGERFPLDQPGVTAGQKGQIALTDDPLVAAQHARFTQLGESVYVEDMGSPQGVYLWIREPYRLKDGDIFQIGRQRLRFVEHGEALPPAKNFAPVRTAILAADSGTSRPGPVLLRLNSNDEEVERYALRGAETSFGRSKGTYTFPDDPYLSTIHAQIRLQQDKCVLEDLRSTNGTFARIRKRALAREGDTLKIGRQLLRVVGERPSDRHA
jgi:class 3 adenylate cyclase/pSer/pThr/pTyr-binding forkhead associated (FHA) protein